MSRGNTILPGSTAMHSLQSSLGDVWAQRVETLKRTHLQLNRFIVKEVQLGQ